MKNVELKNKTRHIAQTELVLAILCGGFLFLICVVLYEWDGSTLFPWGKILAVFLAALGCVSFYIFINKREKRLLSEIACPECGKTKLRQKENSDKIVFLECPDCKIEWETDIFHGG